MRLSVFCLLILIHNLSCSIWEDERVMTLVFDSLPVSEDYPAGDWTIKTISTSGQLSTYTLQSPQTNYMITWPKEESGLVLLYPPLWRNQQFYPAGGIIDAGSNQDISLTWENGFGVSFLFGITEKGFNFAEFNLPRFLDEIHSCSPENPWLVDSDRLAESFSRGQMRSWYIRKSSLFPIQMNIPEGEWLSLYMAEEWLPLLDEESSDTNAYLFYEGYQCYIDLNSSKVWELQINSDGSYYDSLRTF